MHLKNLDMNYKRLGNYIQLVDNRNRDGAVTLFQGISNKKHFMIPKQIGVNTLNAKIVKRGQFAYNRATARNGEKISIAYRTEDICAVSAAYSVFKIIDEQKLLPEFLLLWFTRAEFDRYARFNSWGSARETFDWDIMCDVHLPIPDVEEQEKYVALYKGLLSNQKTYEKSLDDLQLICDTYIENLIKTEEHKILGDYIQQSDKRNSDLEIDFLQGVSTSKILIDSKANTTGVSLRNYRIVRNGQFVYVADTSRRGDKIALAMNNSKDCIVSAIYTVFDVKDTDELLPEYLYLFFQRTEFDRYARFNSWGSARETFDWDEMCNVKLPVPDIKIQEAIVTIYHTLETRKKINEQLKGSIKPLCPVLIRGVVEEMRKKEVSI